MTLRRRKPRDPKPERPEKPEKPTPPPISPSTPAPAPAPATALSRLTGTVRTIRANGNEPYGIPWSNVTRYDLAFTNAGREFSVDPALLAAMAVLESDANHYWPGTRAVITRDDGFGDGLSVGIMQVKPKLWQSLVPDADAYDPVGNIRLGAALMARAIRDHGSWEEALTRVYFPTNDPNGTTQSAYVETVRSLLAEITNNTKPAPYPKPDPKPDPKPLPVDPISIILGGRPHGPITYGWLADEGLNYYGYGVNHGTQRSTQHPGVDVPAPHLTSLYSPAAGVVDCVGAAGAPRWGQGCGAYPDVTDGGIGNITILLDSGHKLTLGHCHSATVRPGERVRAGQQVGTVGNMNGDHVHVEVSVNRNGTYWLIEPVAALREAMGGAPVSPEPVYAATVPVPQPGELTTFATITALKAGVPVRQRAHSDAPAVRAPLRKGETFETAQLILGDEGDWWWITRTGARVPLDGTDASGQLSEALP